MEYDSKSIEYSSEHEHINPHHVLFTAIRCAKRREVPFLALLVLKKGIAVSKVPLQRPLHQQLVKTLSGTYIYVYMFICLNILRG